MITVPGHELNQPFADDWLRELESGTRNQGRRALCGIDRLTRSYCCLGVAVEALGGAFTNDDDWLTVGPITCMHPTLGTIADQLDDELLDLSNDKLVEVTGMTNEMQLFLAHLNDGATGIALDNEKLAELYRKYGTLNPSGKMVNIRQHSFAEIAQIIRDNFVA